MSEICGISQEKIRKAYFSNKIQELLCEIQKKESIEEDELKELHAYLELLKAEHQDALKTLNSVLLGDGKIAPPGVDELMGNIDGEKLEKWKKTSC